MGNPRRLWALVQGLPPDAATQRNRGWTQADELAATQMELLDVWGRNLTQVLWVGLNLRGRPRFGEPLRIEHPGRAEPEKKKQRASAAEVRDFFARLN